MKILFLSDNFPPETNAPATRTFEHARRWVELGHQVTVVTGAPNFPEGIVHPGYRNAWYRRENMAGIRVVRVKTFIAANEGFLLRTLDYLSFMVGGLLGGLAQPRPDIVIGTSPQFFTGIAACLVAGLKRRPFVFEVRDLWPEVIVVIGAMRRGLAIRMLEAIERFLYRRARLIVTATPGLKEELVARGLPADRIAVITNGVDTTVFHPMEPDPDLARELGLQDKFVVGYIGTQGLAHGLGSVLTAAESLRDRQDICFLLVGSGAAQQGLATRIKEDKLGNVVLLPRQTRDAIPKIWSLCDVALVTLRDVPLFRHTLPFKMFEAMAMGRPIVLAAPEGGATRLVRELAAGLAVAPEDPEAIRDAIVSLKNDVELRQRLARCAHAAAPRFSRVKLAETMLVVLQGALADEI